MILIDTQKEEFDKLKEIRVFGKLNDYDYFHGDMLIIGFGGVGSEVVKNLKDMLTNDPHNNITPEDNVHFLMIDSDIPSMEQTIADSEDGIGFNASEVISVYRPNLAEWKDPENPETTIGINGASGNRKVGNYMFANAYQDIRVLLFDKLDELYNNAYGRKIDVILVSSVAGGTGAPMVPHISYNIRAYARAKKWSTLRIGGCLLMPDVLYANNDIISNRYTYNLLNTNSYESLKEIERYMTIAGTDDEYVYDDGTHRIKIRADIFDSCMLVTGKANSDGSNTYVDQYNIMRDTAHFLYKLATTRYVNDNSDDYENGVAYKRLLRDEFFSNPYKDERTNQYLAGRKPNFKAIAESDYVMPIREIENICEKQIFLKAYNKLYDSPLRNADVQQDIAAAFEEITTFLSEKPGDEIHLNVNGIMNTKTFQKPTYKEIKKKQDGLREALGKNLSSIENDIPVIVKAMKLRLWPALEAMINKYLAKYGPFAVIELIGAQNVGQESVERGLTYEVRKLENLHRQYSPFSDFTRVIDSIKEIVAKRFFTFPSAKRETENGYYENCIKEALAKERHLIINGLNDQDFFGDTIRFLKEKAERIEDNYTAFGDDLKMAVSSLASRGEATVETVLKSASRHDFIPSDYITDARIEAFKDGLIRLMINNEQNIDKDGAVSIKPEMEKVYKEFFMGIGTYGPEKMMSVAFSDELLTLQQINIMFASPTNETRNYIMSNAAAAFVRDISEVNHLCIFDPSARMVHKKFISLPDALPQLSAAMKGILCDSPYHEVSSYISYNHGEIEISMNDFFYGFDTDALYCMKQMKECYDYAQYMKNYGDINNSNNSEADSSSASSDDEDDFVGSSNSGGTAGSGFVIQL